MSYYQQHHDPRYFANHPQFPEPEKSSSWFGWLLMVFGALIGGFFLGQSVKVETQSPTKDKSILSNEDDTSATLVDEPEIKPESFKKFADLSDDIIEKYTADFDNLNLAERLFCKRGFQENPELIIKYPILAKLLGL